MKKVLVLLSTYNGEKYLNEQMMSLINQKEVDLDVLIRDDGSQDGTIKYLRELKDERINFWEGENKGVVGSFFELIQRASDKYDFYAFCDQDDVWLEDKISKAVDNLKKFDKSIPSLYYSGQIIVDERMNILYEHNLDIKRSVEANCIFNQMAGCTAVFNNKLLQKLKEYTPSGIYGHDVWCYRVCAALEGNIVVDSKGYILYRQHCNNAVGMRNGVKGKLHRAQKYIFKYSSSDYAREILTGYGEQISERWEKFLSTICYSNCSWQAKYYLINNKNIRFNSGLLRMLFVIKVLTGNM